MATNSKDAHKEWECDKCNSTYSSPIKVMAVLCTTCSKRLKARETWMKPRLRD